MLSGGAQLKNIRRHHFPIIHKMKEKMGHVAYSYSTMLVSSNLKLPSGSHIKTPGSLSLQ